MGSKLPNPVRLACIRPAASVHPEPGSNSPLYMNYLFLTLLLIIESVIIYFAFGFVLTTDVVTYPLRFILLFLYLKNFLAAPSQFGYIFGSFNAALNLFSIRFQPCASSFPASALQLPAAPFCLGLQR